MGREKQNQNRRRTRLTFASDCRCHDEPEQSADRTDLYSESSNEVATDASKKGIVRGTGGVGPDQIDFEDDFEGTVQILAFDPGGTTGWSLFEFSPESISAKKEHRNFHPLSNVIRWKHGQIDCGSRRGDAVLDPERSKMDPGSSGEAAGIGEILGLCRSWPNAAIVVEDFILDPKRFNTGRDLLSPVRITAGIHYDLWLQERRMFVQSPSTAKSTFGDEQLKAARLYTSAGGLNHARDADRHALTFVRRAAQVNPKGRALREMAWPHLFAKGGEFYDRGSR